MYFDLPSVRTGIGQHTAIRLFCFAARLSTATRHTPKLIRHHTQQATVSLVGFGGSESHQFSIPSLFTPNLADPAELCDATSHSTQNGQRSRADAGSVGPSDLDRKNGAFQSTVRSHQLSPYCQA